MPKLECTLTTEGLADHLGGITPSQYVSDCLAFATELVAKAIGTAVIPQTVIDLAVREAAAELYHRRNAPNGVKNFADMDAGQVIRIARDPMVAARPIIAPYLPLGFA